MISSFTREKKKNKKKAKKIIYHYVFFRHVTLHVLFSLDLPVSVCITIRTWLNIRLLITLSRIFIKYPKKKRKKEDKNKVINSAPSSPTRPLSIWKKFASFSCNYSNTIYFEVLENVNLKRTELSVDKQIITATRLFNRFRKAIRNGWMEWMEVGGSDNSYVFLQHDKTTIYGSLNFFLVDMPYFSSIKSYTRKNRINVREWDR